MIKKLINRMRTAREKREAGLKRRANELFGPISPSKGGCNKRPMTPRPGSPKGEGGRKRFCNGADCELDCPEVKAYWVRFWENRRDV